MVFGGGRAEQQAALSGQLAALASAELPLGPGLRALAGEVPGRSLRKALVHLANRLDAGMSPAEALEATSALPPHLRGAMQAGLRTGHLGQVLAQYAAMERHRLELNRRVRSGLRYPAILAMTGVGMALLFLLWVTPGFARILSDFGVPLIPAARTALWLGQRGFAGFLGLVGVFVEGLAVLRLGGRRGWIASSWRAIPVVGPLWRFLDLAEFSRWMALLVEQEVPLPEALRLAAGGLRARYLGAAACRAARRLEQGAPLAEVLRGEKAFAPTLAVLVGPAAAGALAEAFRIAADLFAGRADAQAQRLQWLALPVAALLALSLVGFVLASLFLPLISLIQRLA